MSSSWLFLGLAILAEVAGTISMKVSGGLSRPLPTVLIFLFYTGAFCCMAMALKEMPVSQAYAVWCAVGIIAVTAIGVIFFGEPFSLVKGLSILVIIFGIVGLTYQS